ncbi:hypothetical protein FE257_009322 [Aspergillus nanangensis]|uniref:Uncharacterized protein n=1 Tax=Aspergillus nanangensis TaxID=2582783 RepID=A0AAD4GSV6_ASPNN|nr:hypothetical protein FE257_009322 [Aspergillus nanangensis]
MYTIVADSSHRLQPSQQQLDEALEQSSSYWHRMSDAAECAHGEGIRPYAANPHHMLQKVPRMRGNPRETHVAYNMMCFTASTRWVVEESTACSGLRMDKSHTTLFHMGTKTPVPLTLDGDGFRHWIGTKNEKQSGPNYLAILVLGWCYILSARLVEMQHGREGAAMQYTHQQAHLTSYNSDPDAGLIAIDIGSVNEDTLSWWRAILSSSPGWKAVVKECKEGTFHAPWSVQNIDSQRFGVKWGQNKTIPTQSSSSSFSRPLSSGTAYATLARFALFHNLGSQFLVAFASALTIPTHNHYGSTVHLPKPRAMAAQCPATQHRSSWLTPPDWAALHYNLDYYITLSCSAETVISSLCGMFWEPGVPCNLASAWLHPILTEFPAQPHVSGTPGRFAELLAIIAGLRRPSISALWLGAVVSGLTQIILRKATTGCPPLDPAAFPWTGATQSFMDITSRVRSPYDGAVGQQQREPYLWQSDIMRLLSLLPPKEEDGVSYTDNPPPPLRTPWEPCGKMKIEDGDSSYSPRVACHLRCARHWLSYRGLDWEVHGGLVIHDRGRSQRDPVPEEEEGINSSLPGWGKEPFLRRPLSQKASEEASLEAFRWFVVNGGRGIPSELIYKSEWLEPLRGDKDCDDKSGEEIDHEGDADPDP